MKIIHLPPDENTSHGQKRQYFSCVLECNCPKCNIKVRHDFSEKYVNYPAWGKQTDVWLWCQDCEHEWSVPIIPEISIKLL